MNFDSNRIFEIKTDKEFEQLALEIFNFQYANNPIYNAFVSNLRLKPASIKCISEIPFLPIEFFKSKDVVCNNMPVQELFLSSATTGSIQSRHLVSNVGLYEKSFRTAFRSFIGNEADMIILGLLPSYLERSGSSLIYMVQDLISGSKNENSGFFLHDFDALEACIRKNKNKKIVLFGVSYALLDFAAHVKTPLPEIKIIETGGMKGVRKEITKQELYNEIQQSLGISTIYSEYGMTELLSQAYSVANAEYSCPPWMKVLIREINDPFSYEPEGRSGGINIIDLANVYSCSFIETKDLGMINKNITFQILGRIDNSDTRGCNLMINS